jgi:hypothetical protein
VYTLFLVVVLRRHVKAGRSRRSLVQQSIAFTQIIEVKAEGGREPDVSYSRVGETGSGITIDPVASSQQHSRSGALKQAGGLSQNELALSRLASDLSYAVPLTILMAVVLIVCVGIIAGKGGNLDSWALIEFVSSDITSEQEGV